MDLSIPTPLAHDVAAPSEARGLDCATALCGLIYAAGSLMAARSPVPPGLTKSCVALVVLSTALWLAIRGPLRWARFTFALALGLSGAARIAGLWLLGHGADRLQVLGLGDFDILLELVRTQLAAGAAGGALAAVQPEHWALISGVVSAAIVCAAAPRLAWIVPLAAVPFAVQAQWRPPVDHTGRGLVRVAAMAEARTFSMAELPPVRPVPPLPRATRPRAVVLVLVESGGAEVLDRHVRSHPGCVFRRWMSEGVFFSQVVSVANVSHLAQPAILTSHNFIRRAGRHLQPSAEPYPVYSAAAYFHDKGYRTLMVSSQDENWLDMDSIILAQPWDSIAEASRLPRNDPSLYEDACGTHKVRDSSTVRRFADELGAALRDGPAFGYLNLQNTHYPYLLEHEPPLPILPTFTCADLQDFPARRLPEAVKREQLALLNTERRLAKLVQQFPDAMFAFVGDHGEHLVAGRRFAHSKSAVPAEIDTFLFLLNTGLPPTRIDDPISTLDVLPTLMGRVDAADVGRIPRGMLAGRDVLAGDRFHRSGPLVTTSSGLGEPSFVLRSGPVAYELLSDSERCTRNGAAIPSQTPECRDAAVAVERWLSCTVRFEELARSGRLKGFFNPCVLR